MPDIFTKAKRSEVMSRQAKRDWHAPSPATRVAAMSNPASHVSKVKNGVVPIPHGLKLAEGTDVALIPLAPLPGAPPFLKLALKLAKPRGWPKDFALNHGHHVKGQRKK